MHCRFPGTALTLFSAVEPFTVTSATLLADQGRVPRLSAGELSLALMQRPGCEGAQELELELEIDALLSLAKASVQLLILLLSGTWSSRQN